MIFSAKKLNGDVPAMFEDTTGYEVEFAINWSIQYLK
jgi:hypothetical protein